jgi:regulator of replication initiation timing
MKANRRKLPSNETIEDNKQKLKNFFQKVASGEIEVKRKKETISDKLMLIKDELLLLKDKGIPYPVMAKMIEENIGLKVSEQTLRQFCQTRLGFPKATRKSKDKVKPQATKKPKQNTGYSASGALSKNNNFE